MITLEQLIIGWFYYGIFYMGFSVVATWMLNKVFNRLIWAPLIVNFVSLFVMFVLYWYNQDSDQFWFNLFFVYMPIVFASFMTNIVIYLFRKRKSFFAR